MSNLYSKKEGFSLIEAILAASLFALIITTFTGAFFYARESLALSADREQAILLAEEGLEAVRNIKEGSFSNLIDGTYGLIIIGNEWHLSGSFDVVDKFRREVIISTINTDTKQIAANISWQQNEQRTGFVSLVNYLTNWQELSGGAEAGRAWLSGDRTTYSTNFNQASPYAVEWNSYDYNSSAFNFNPSNPTELVLLQDGDLLIGLTLPFERIDANNSRTRIQAEIRVNNVKQDVGVARSSYIRNAGSHSESSNHLHVLLTNLSAGDIVEVYTQGVTDVDAGDQVIASEQVNLYAEYITNNEIVFSATAFQTTLGPDLNQATPAELEWAETRIDNGYTHANDLNPEEIIINQTGSYLVLVNIPLNGGARANIIGRVLLDGAQVPGGRFKQGYIRDNENDVYSSIHWSGVVTTTLAGQILSVDVAQEANSGTVTTFGELATIYIQALPSDSIFISGGNNLTNGTNWNPATTGLILWEIDDVIDTNVYTHSTSLNPEMINIEEAGDYLLVYNDSLVFSGGTARPNALIEILINNIPASGAQTKTHYIRDRSGNDESSASLVYFLKGLSEGDEIKIQASREASDGILDDDTEAILMLWQKYKTGGGSGCSCSDWSNNICGGGVCLATQMQQVRTCDPPSCDFESQCADDSCSSWVNQTCGSGSCTIDEMYQIRTCTLGCDIEEQCDYDDCSDWGDWYCVGFWGGSRCRDRTCEFSCQPIQECEACPRFCMNNRCR